MTDMMGCVRDMAEAPPPAKQAAASEARRARAEAVRMAVIMGHARELVARAEDERDALMKRPRRDVEDTVLAIRRGAVGLLDDE